MKVFYLSSSAFSDNQINLLHHFPKEYEITYGVIIPNKNSNYSEKELADYCNQHHIKLVPFPLKYRFRDPRLLLTYYKIITTVKKANPDVIFVANFDQLYLNILLLLLDKKRTIIAMHDVINHSKTAFNRLTTLGKKVLINRFEKFLTYSQPQANLLKEIFNKKEVYCIPLPLIGFGKLPDLKKKEGITFLFFGNILHYKGLDLLLEAVSRLGIKYQNFRLLIAGRCLNWEQQYKPLILNKDQVSAHIGFIENHQIPSYFAEADYIVLPYRDTTQSGPLMIAYNYNVPILASNAAGFNEFFESGTSGYMFDLNKPNDLDRLLEEAILRNPSDYLNLKEKQAEYTNEHFAMSKLVQSYQHMFDDVAEHGPRKKIKYETSQ
ncbi:glycosyltransferase family 4 protein [Arcticibacter eurypsychrophilus]|uniref:glycosyltransferase family 4 protein n=1 Tax=Arcticibacter eurypsychrophilus TaxID=1434752 RepID=UPI00084DCFBA|nr:glycosyltransferase family 4 protein [Arcticibacter eurypsychrophilus]